LAVFVHTFAAMKIKTIKTHDISFHVKAFWNEESGMGEDSYGKVVHELHEAIEILELAKISDPKTDWIVVCYVDTKITTGQNPLDTATKKH